MPPIDPAFGAFLDDLVHELRTPLTAIAGYAALLAEDAGELTPELRHATDVIDAQSQRLGAQLALLLDVARLWSGRAALARRRVDLAGLARAAARIHALPADAPARLTVTGDRVLLARALAMLVDNAVRHGAPPISISVTRSGDRVNVTVSDRGPGLPPGRASQAGLRPFQSPPRDGAPQGTGLSLVLVAAVADQHGGALSYAREDGASRFTLTLPAPRRTSQRGDRG